MFDWNRINELCGEIGPENFAEVVDLFLEEVETAILDLPSQGSAQEIEAALHFLKGSALNLGFSDLSSLCQVGEILAVAGRVEEFDTASVSDCYFQSKQAFFKDLPSYLT